MSPLGKLILRYAEAWVGDLWISTRNLYLVCRTAGFLLSDGVAMCHKLGIAILSPVGPAAVASLLRA